MLLNTDTIFLMYPYFLKVSRLALNFMRKVLVPDYFRTMTPGTKSLGNFSLEH
jgi:hypothetical protein